MDEIVMLRELHITNISHLFTLVILPAFMTSFPSFSWKYIIIKLTWSSLRQNQSILDGEKIMGWNCTQGFLENWTHGNIPSWNNNQNPTDHFVLPFMCLWPWLKMPKIAYQFLWHGLAIRITRVIGTWNMPHQSSTTWNSHCSVCLP